MADTTTPALPALPAAPARLRWPRRKVLIGLAAGVAAVLLVGLAGWWVAGSRFWTDGAAVRVPDADVRLREVVWTRPEPLAGLNTPDHEYEPALSPDGDELYFVRGKAGTTPGGPAVAAHLFVSYRKAGAWTTPVPVEGVNSEYDDLGPRVSGDGRFLLFYSNRPGGFGGYDIYAAPRLAAAGDGAAKWGKPFNLGPAVNTEFDEYNPDPSPDGRQLYFATNRKAASREQKNAWRATIRAGTNADFDLWYAERDEAAEQAAAPGGPATAPTTEPSDNKEAVAAKPQAAVAVLAFRNAVEVPGVNTPFSEGASCVSPAGDFLYFASDRPGGLGRFDIYRCRIGTDGKFGPVENVGPPINTPDNETDPQLALNGFRLYFSSDRPVVLTGAGPAAGGGYDLLQSDSREVYLQRSGRPLPHLGWSWLIMVLSLMALIPLVMFMRKWDDQRLSLIQKCLMVSLLVHVLVVLVLSMRRVTTDVIHYVRQEQGLEPPIDFTLTLNGPPGKGDSAGEVTDSVRQLSSNDVPAATAPPTAVTPQALPGAEALEAPAGVPLNVPQAGVGGPVVTVRVEAPRLELPKPADVSAAVAPVMPQATAAPLAGPEVALPVPAAPHLSGPEAAPRAVADAGAPAARAEAGPAVQIPSVDAVAAGPAAPAQASAGSLAQPVAVRPAVPSIALPDVGPQAAAPDAAAAPAVRIAPAVAAAPVASHGPEAPAAPEASVAAARQAVESSLPTVAMPAPAGPAAPAALAPTGASTAADPVAPARPEAGAVALARGAAGAVAVRPADPAGLPEVGVTAPPAPGGAGKVSGSEATASTEQLPGSTRQGEAAGSPAVRPADVGGAAGATPAARATGESLAGTPGAAARVAPPEAAAVTPAGPDVGSAADLPIRPVVPTAGPVASRQPDAPTAGEVLAGPSREGPSAGPGRPAAVPEAALPTASRPAPGEGDSMAAAPAAAPRAVGDAAAGGPVASVTPGAPASLAAPDLTHPAPAGPSKVTAAGQPDAPAAAEAAAGVARRGTPEAATQPSATELARAAGASDSKLPAVGGTSESLAGAPALPQGSAGARPVAPAGPVAVAAASPVGDVAVSGRAAPARQHADEAAPSAAAAPQLTAGPATRPGSAAVAAAGAPREIGQTVPVAPAAPATAGDLAAAAPSKPLDPSRAVAMAGPPVNALPRPAQGDFPAAPEVGTPRATTPLAHLAEAAAALQASDVAAGPRKVAPASPAAAGSDVASAPNPIAVPAAAAAPTVKGNPAGGSLASPAGATPREVVAAPVVPSAGKAVGPAPIDIGVPRAGLPKVALTPPAPARAGAGASGGGADLPAAAAEGPAIRVTRTAPRPKAGATDPQGPAAAPGAQLASATIPGVSAFPVNTSADPASRTTTPAAVRVKPRTVAGPSVTAPEVGVALPTLAAPEALFQRSAEQRKPLVEQRGGTQQSEDAVERALAYLSRQQEPDGRWTVFMDDGKPGKRGRHPHDMACTALATLAFLTADHTPAKEGPYRAVVSRSLDYLLAQQGLDGDLRGPKGMRGEGADVGNFYDQGICTMALAEAALMTGDRRYTDAALKAADFIVRNQHPQGGWRYAAGQPGDTSVLGWQVLALHDAEQLGYKVPEQTKTKIGHYLKSVSQGKTKILAGYLPGSGPTYAMTSEALFARLLLGEEIGDAQTKEVSEFLTGNLPQPGGADFYFWYYASLSLSQMPEVAKADAQSGGAGKPGAVKGDKADVSSEAWKKWNGKARDTLIAMQKKGGPADGCWSQSEWAERGGRVFTTSLATLTLEVYYRYLPLRRAAADDEADAPGEARRASAEVKGSAPAGSNAAPAKRGAAGGGERPGGKPRRGWNDRGGHYPAVEPN